MKSGITDFKFTEHALFEIRRRGLNLEIIKKVVKEPQQVFEARPGRMVFQSKMEHEGREFLFRIFVDIDRKPAEIVTAYKTSKIRKYWRRTS